MVKLYEVLKDITPLTYTGYYVEVPSLSCIKDYKHNYITKHADLKKRRLTNPEQYEYVASAAASPTPSCHDISDANGFITCLSSCGFDCSVILQPNAMITLTNNITYSKMNLTIRANDAYFINGVSNEEWTGIIVDSFRNNFPISLQNLDICGVNLSVSNHNSLSPALQCTSGLIIREGTHSFYNNMADSSGGAIYATDISLINTNIIFKKNYSNKNGGAIYAKESLTIRGDGTNILFHDNSASSGGAISSGKNINLIDASITFRNNQTSQHGGAIYALDSLAISGDNTNLTFHDNSALYNGGAIYTNYLTIKNISGGGLDFCNNLAWGEDSTNGKGGAIFAMNDISLIDASITFRNNRTWYGLRNSLVCKNRLAHCPSGSGGAIFANNLTITGDRTNLLFNNNKGRVGGGAIAATYLNIANTSKGYMNCISNNAYDGDGGAFFSQNIRLIDVSIVFNQNMTDGAAGHVGGAIATRQLSYYEASHNEILTISGDSTYLIFNNNISAHGGAIYANNLNITNTSKGYIDFFDNQARQEVEEGGGGAISVENDISLIDTNIVFKKNWAFGAGGAIKISSGILTISGNNNYLEFNNNISYQYGGAIFARGGTYNSIIINNTQGIIFKNNKVLTGGQENVAELGGAICSYYNISIIDASITFIDNIVSIGSLGGMGGAIAAFNFNTDASLANVIITGDKTNIKFYASPRTSSSLIPPITQGGAIAADNVTIKDIGSGSVDFCYNIVSKTGGAIYSKNDISLIDANITFRHNEVFRPLQLISEQTSMAMGGAIAGTDIYLIDASITFMNNYVNGPAGPKDHLEDHIYKGAAIYTTESLTISGNKTNLIFNDNNSTGWDINSYGAAIYMDSNTTLTIQPNLLQSYFSFLNNQPNAIYFDPFSQIIQSPPLNNITCEPSGGRQCMNLSAGIQYNYCYNISDTNGFITCLSSCRDNEDCLATLKPNAMITLSNQISYPNMNLIIRANEVSNQEWPEINMSRGRINLHSLDISGINLSIHDRKDTPSLPHPVLNCLSDLIIREGNHIFHNNQANEDGIVMAKDINLIDASITFMNNLCESGGILNVKHSLTITGNKTNLIFKDNSSGRVGALDYGFTSGGIYMDKSSSLTIQSNLSKSHFLFENNTPNAISFDTSSQIIKCPPLNIDCSNHPGEGQCTDLSNGTLSKYCNDISDTTGFMTCLSSCSLYENTFYDCPATLKPTAPITLSNDIVYNNMNLIIRANGEGNSYLPKIELSGYQIGLHSLDISGVNLSIHDSSSSRSALTCASDLIIGEGNHSFYNNKTSSEGGAIKASDISLIDASITFMHNYSSNHSGGGGGAIYAANSLTITGNKTYLIFKNNSSKYDGGAIYSEKTINIEYINNDNKIMFYNNRGGWDTDTADYGNGGAIYVGYPGSLTIKNISGGGIDFCNNTCGGVEVGNEVGGGGAIFSNSNVQLIDATIIFRNNNTGIYGGAIHIKNTEFDGDKKENTLTISGDNTNITFHDNSAFNNGGAIYISPYTHLIIQPDISISDFSFLRNTPHAIYFDYSSQIITCPPLNIDCSNLLGEDQCNDLSSGIP